MTALFERLAARAAAIAPLAVPGLQLVPRGAIALAEHVNRYYRVLHGTDPENVAVRLPTGGGSFEVRHSATNAALLRVTDAGLDFPAGGIGTVEIADGAVTSAKILDGTIVDADVAAAANIAGSKLLNGSVTSAKILDGTIAPADLNAPLFGPNTMLMTQDGVSMYWGTAIGAMIADGQVTSLKIADGTILNVDVNATAGIAYGKLALTNSIVNADIAPAGTAQIAVNKLLHVGAGNVLRSDGAQNVAGQVTSGDIADGTIVNADINAAAAINGSKLADNSVTSAKLAGGIPVPAGSITTTEIADGTIMNVDVNAAAGIVVAKLAHVGAGNVLKSNGTANVGGQVATADIAANAATQAITVGLPGSSTTSAAMNNMPGASLTITTTGGPVLILATLLAMSNDAGTLQGSVELWELSSLATLILNDNTTLRNTRFGHSIITPSAGAHTYILAWATVSGTMRFIGGQFTAIELKR